MADIDVVTGTVVVEEHFFFTFAALCQACGADAELIHALVAEGLLQPEGQSADDWRFGGDALPQARKAVRLVRDLELNLPGVALVMELLDEIERLRSRLRRDDSGGC